MVNIVCHIVGMNNKIKEEFIKICGDSYPYITIIDLDIITNQIRSDKNMTNLNKQLNSSKTNTQIIKEINQYWKRKLNDAINEELNKNDTHIIFLGLSTYHRNHRLRVNIDTHNKFFLKMDNKVNASDTVEYNLNKYHKYIINGTFPLTYLDHNFIINQRDRLINVYTNMDYKMKTLQNINNWLTVVSTNKINNNSINGTKDTKDIINNTIENKYIYIAIPSLTNKTYKLKRSSKLNVKNFLGDGDNSVIGYREPWLAILSSISNIKKYIKKGYLKKNGVMTPFIEEIYSGSFDKLHKSCNIHTINSNNFEKITWYKYKLDNNILNDSQNVQYIPDIIEYLKELGIHIIKK